jgi:DNA ligase-1
MNDVLNDISSGFAAFAEMIRILGISTKTNDKLEALVKYFLSANDKDKVWAIAMFSGRKPKRFVSSTLLQLWCGEITGLPQWLFHESYLSVGDLSETIALLLPPNFVHHHTLQADEFSTATGVHEKTLAWYLECFIQLEKQDEAVKKKFILDNWNELDATGRFVFNKLISGNFRIGVSQQLVINALSKVVQLEAPVVAHRISGNWDPSSISFEELMFAEPGKSDASKPYPFYLAYPLEDAPETLGDPPEWQAEWKWDGIRGQIIKRNDELFVWSRGEELITEKFPEYEALKIHLENGICLDGEIIALEHSTNEDGSIAWKPLSFSYLQTRIGRKNITKKQLQEAPVGLIVYDLLEYEGEDYRQKSLDERRSKLESIIGKINQPHIQLSPVVIFSSWDELASLRENSRDRNSEGIMLKRRSSIYQVGRKRGDWWKWKIDALTIDAVMIYAQKGSGRRSSLYTDYTFAVKDGEKLVPFAKAYGGLTDKEFAQVDAFVKRNSLEKFGPVRTVKPELVFEIAFEGIAASTRHKSGVALRFPRMSRWRHDKKPDEINTLDDLKKMLELYGNRKR